MHPTKALISIFALSGLTAAQDTDEDSLARRLELVDAREELLLARDNYLAVRDKYLAIRAPGGKPSGKTGGKTGGKTAPKNGGGFEGLTIRPKAAVGKCMVAPGGKVLCMVGTTPCKKCQIPPEVVGGPCTCPVNHPTRI
ncbi:unnamed protein product [Clonostachys rosea]|uniref:Uncharacterized protein n=1 Tax=Bionectria ochroleuca TaxID=29856 RepID=A0ABY6UCQ2_BIOOC|nr:unnamed protein product [Clonostachys rosea]